MKFRIVEKQLTNSSIYVQGGRSYLVTKRAKNPSERTYLTCRLRRERHCKGKGFIKPGGRTITLYQDHTCPEEVLIGDALQAKEDMYQLAYSEPDLSPHRVYMKISQNYPVDVLALVSFKEVQSTLKRRKRISCAPETRKTFGEQEVFHDNDFPMTQEPE